MDPTKPAKVRINRPLARKVSIGLGVAALSFLIVAGFLMALVRKSKTVDVGQASASAIAPVKEYTTLPKIQLEVSGLFSTPSNQKTRLKKNILIGKCDKNNPLIWFSVPNDGEILSQYNCQPSNTAVCTKTKTNDCSSNTLKNCNVPYEQIPGMLKVSENPPLKTIPEQFGFLVGISSNTQFIGSLDNGNLRPAVFTASASGTSKNPTKFTLSKNYGTCSEGKCRVTNFAVIQRTSQNTPVCNLDASAVGCLGYRSLAVGIAQDRLYVGFRQPTKDDKQQNPELYKFFQSVGKVATYKNGNGTDNWKFQTNELYANPAGSRSIGFEFYTDPIYTETQVVSDGFGELIRTSINRYTTNPIVAIRSNFAYKISAGRAVNIFEENTSLTGSTFEKNSVTGILQIPPSLTASTSDKRSFAHSFDIKFGIVVATVPTRGSFLWYQLDPDTLVWKYKGEVKGPSISGETFGMDIILHPTGDVCIVGSPATLQKSKSTSGGKVYLYVRSGDTWTLSKTYTDKDHADGSFGMFLNYDVDFRAISITSRQNNQILSEKSTDLQGTVTFYPYDHKEKKLVEASRIVVVQKGDGIMYDDQLFGCMVAIGVDRSTNAIRAFIGSPVNGTAVRLDQGF